MLPLGLVVNHRQTGIFVGTFTLTPLSTIFTIIYTCTTCIIVSIKLRNNPKFYLSFSAWFRYWGSNIPCTGWNGWSLQWTARWEPNFYTLFTRCVRLAAGISPRRPRVNPTWTIGFAVIKVALGQTSLGVQWYPLWLSLHQYSIVLLIFQDTLNRRTNERRLLAFQQTDIFLEIWNLKKKRNIFMMGKVLFS